MRDTGNFEAMTAKACILVRIVADRVKVTGTRNRT